MVQLMVSIVASGRASKVLQEARKLGVRGGTIFRAHGGVKNKFLEFFMLDDVKKEVVWMAMESELEEVVARGLNDMFHFDRPNHGILFTIPLNAVLGMRGADRSLNPKREVKNVEHEAIFIIVDRGKADEVIDAAGEHGSPGATVIHARGSGIEDGGGLFNFTIEPEKEIVLIVSEKKRSQEIIDRIYRDFHIDKPGKGIIFAVDVNRVWGLREANGA